MMEQRSLLGPIRMGCIGCFVGGVRGCFNSGLPEAGMIAPHNNRDELLPSFSQLPSYASAVKKKKKKKKKKKHLFDT